MFTTTTPYPGSGLSQIREFFPTNRQPYTAIAQQQAAAATHSSSGSSGSGGESVHAAFARFVLFPIDQVRGKINLLSSGAMVSLLYVDVIWCSERHAKRLEMGSLLGGPCPRWL